MTMLNDTDIAALIMSNSLLTNHSANNIQNCAYALRAGKAFEPGSGDELILKPQHHHWTIGPSEVLIIETRERVKIPGDLCASYTPLQSLASKGVMLINASIVEPYYEGNLSCFVVNFSSRKITLAPDDRVAKITFHRLGSAPGKPKPLVLDSAAYDRSLADSATNFSSSFLDVASISNAAAEKARGALRSVVIGGGALVAILLLWASLEPLFSGWLWEKTGVTSATHRMRDAELASSVEQLSKDIEHESQLRSLNLKLDALQAQLEDLRNRNPGRASGK